MRFVHLSSIHYLFMYILFPSAPHLLFSSFHSALVLLISDVHCCRTSSVLFVLFLISKVRVASIRGQDRQVGTFSNPVVAQTLPDGNSMFVFTRFNPAFFLK